MRKLILRFRIWLITRRHARVLLRAYVLKVKTAYLEEVLYLLSNDCCDYCDDCREDCCEEEVE